MKKANIENNATQKQLNTILASGASKSQKMKELFELGMEVKDIATTMNVRYNFVYNVVSNHVRMNDIETQSVERSSKKSEIIALKENGLTPVQISKELKINYNYVHKVLKEQKAELEAQAQ